MTNNLTPRPEVRGAIVGVDTHKHIHVAVAIDTCGIHLGDQSFAADSGGYQALLTWAETHGRIQAFGIEGTGGYGVGLARAVRRAGHRVVEVNRADRRLRRVAGKSDRIDAEAAARSVLAGQATATPKTADGAVEMIRQLKVARVLAPVAVDRSPSPPRSWANNRGFPPGTLERCTRSTGWPAPSAGVTTVENGAAPSWATARFRRSGADAGGTAARSAGERSARTRGQRTAAFAALVGNATRSRACASRV